MAGEPLITVIGNLVADPEPRVSQAGKSWVTFRMAQTPRVKDQQAGTWGDGTATWFSCRAYGELADNIAASLMKGQRVIVLGRMSTREYTDQQGNQRSSLDLEVEAMGPELRFHVATPVRASEQRQAAPNAWGSQGQQQAQGQPAWGQPAAPQPDGGNPWASQQPQQATQQPQQQQGGQWQGGGQQNAPQQPQGQQQGGFGGGFDDEQPF